MNILKHRCSIGVEMCRLHFPWKASPNKILLAAAIFSAASYLRTCHYQVSNMQSEHFFVESMQNVRVLCLVMTKSLNNSLVTHNVRITWGKKCNVLIFASSSEDSLTFKLNNLVTDEVRLRISEAFHYLWNNYSDQVDWFVRTDDETFVVVDNLRAFVSSLNSSEPSWFSWRRPNSQDGASYVLSSELIKRFDQNGRCELGSDVMDSCLIDLGATLIDTVDPSGEERFRPFNSAGTREERSTNAIAYYGVGPNDMLTLDYLINKVKTNEPTIKLGDPEVNNSRIFFLETSGRPSLRLRHACAVESAAKENPDRQIQVLIFNSTPEIGSPSMDVFKHYPNIQVYSLTFEEYFNNTPLDEWFQEGKWRTSRYSVAHLSDYLRIVSLWKGGGIYMDTDFVVLRSLQGLANFSCTEGAGVTSNGVIGLDVGHPLLETLVKIMSGSYNPTFWSINGPGALGAALRFHCNETDVKLMSPSRCGGYRLLPPQYFYPIHYTSWRRIFKEIESEAIATYFKDSYAIHMWNKLSFNTTVRVGSKQLYALVAAKHCPHVFATAATVF